jgi:hypothetical protein
MMSNSRYRSWILLSDYVEHRSFTIVAHHHVGLVGRLKVGLLCWLCDDPTRLISLPVPPLSLSRPPLQGREEQRTERSQ